MVSCSFSMERGEILSDIPLGKVSPFEYSPGSAWLVNDNPQESLASLDLFYVVTD